MLQRRKQTNKERGGMKVEQCEVRNVDVKAMCTSSSSSFASRLVDTSRRPCALPLAAEGSIASRLASPRHRRLQRAQRGLKRPGASQNPGVSFFPFLFITTCRLLMHLSALSPPTHKVFMKRIQQLSRGRSGVSSPVCPDYKGPTSAGHTAAYRKQFKKAGQRHHFEPIMPGLCT